MRVKNRLLSFVFIAICLLLSASSFASHIFGGELLYQNVSGNTYKLTLTLYGDCSATAGTFASLYVDSPLVYVYNNNVLYTSVKLLGVDTQGVEVSPVCPSQLVNTSCNNTGGTLPGVRRFIYTYTITLPSTSASWRFIFAGDLGTVQPAAGRSSQITNINSPSGSTMQIEATLNNIAGPNNSPRYSTIPTPYYCQGIDQQYNQGAIDQDGDSLSFSLVAAINGTTSPLLSGAASYIAPFTPTMPLAVNTGSFSFNAVNGQLAFNPSQAQHSLIVNQVSEYRNGVLIGTSKREMTFIVTDNCDGTPPSLHVADVTGGISGANNIIRVCTGTPLLSFNINIDNPDADNTIITTSGLPAGAVLNVSNNNTPSPSAGFSWATDTLTNGVYTFYVYVQNNHCPLANHQTIAYTINVVPLPTLAIAQLSATGCVRPALLQYTMTLGYTPRTLTITEGGAVVKTYNDTTGLVRDSLAAGSYIAYAGSHPSCQASAAFVVADSGALPLAPFTASYCMGDAATALQLPVPGPGTIITWYDAASNVLPEAPVPATAVAGIETFYATEQYKICTSALTPATVTVHALPDVQILSKPASICYGDTIYLKASGGVEYTWSPESRISSGTDGRLYTRLINGGIFSVKVRSEFGCTDSASVTYSDIQPCCNFSYPNAFTPNGDGHNDGFKVITHGNMYDYRLAIYNRWGQLVFLSANPWQYWDGTLYGTPCETGTYYYYFKGRCLTGITEEKQGDVMLIR